MRHMELAELHTAAWRLAVTAAEQLNRRVMASTGVGIVAEVGQQPRAATPKSIMDLAD